MVCFCNQQSNENKEYEQNQAANQQVTNQKRNNEDSKNGHGVNQRKLIAS